MRSEKNSKTLVWRIDPTLPLSPQLSEAADLLARGELVAFPTETVYGLGANALSEAAIDRLYQAKGRPRANPLIVHVADPDTAKNWTAVWPLEAELLAKAFWPGPLTLILPHGGKIPAGVTAGGATVALRVPDHPVARELLRLANVPVAAPSANPSGRISPTLAEHVLEGLEGRIAGLVAAGPCDRGVESTVVDLSGPEPALLRPGPLHPGEIASILGCTEEALLAAKGSTKNANHPEKSPGRMGRHYAPWARVVCVETADEACQITRKWEALGLAHGWLALEPGPGTILLPANSRDALRALYRTMHQIDKDKITHLVVQLPPRTSEWLAFRDRLARASLEN